MHDPDLRAPAGCRRPGLLPSWKLGRIAARGKSLLTLCLAPLGGWRRHRGSLSAAEEAPAKRLTRRGLPASQTRRLIVSGSASRQAPLSPGGALKRLLV